jgi:hypothetical protein
MGQEEFTVRVTRKGEIIIESGGMEVRRVKDLMAYLEETLGPVKSVMSTDDPSADGRVLLEDDALRELGEDQAIMREDGTRIREDS